MCIYHTLSESSVIVKLIKLDLVLLKVAQL